MAGSTSLVLKGKNPSSALRFSGVSMTILDGVLDRLPFLAVGDLGSLPAAGDGTGLSGCRNRVWGINSNYFVINCPKIMSIITENTRVCCSAQKLFKDFDISINLTL